ncbi:MAG: prepilin peptidase [Peptoniphilus harei]|nr:prepilin peptidase [Peptoniphilus harei]MDU5570265.1 prepilin peptidase [Peptoniphilus harei]
MENKIYKIFIGFLIFMLGGSLASFYDVFIMRREKNENFLWERSHCDSCHRYLKFYELIPVFSYIFLGVKCKTCGEKIGKDKFFAEILISSLSVFAFLKYDLSIQSFLLIGIITVATFIGIIDYKTGFIYNLDLLIILIFTLLLKLFLGESIFNSLKFSFGMGMIFYALYKFTGMMGFGDVLYSFIMGIFANNLLGAFLIFKDAFVIGAVFSIILILLKKKNFKDSIAFGPFISIAIIIFILCR